MPILQTSVLPTGAEFSAKRAMKVINFIEKTTVHTKSVWAKKPFKLEPFQRGSAHKNDAGLWVVDGIVAPVFGAVKWSPMWNRWVRQFSEVWIEMARKQGKSELMAAIGLYLLIADGEWSAEIIGAASDKRQASAVFNVCRDMIRLSPVLSKLEQRGDIMIIDSRKRIIYKPTMSTYEVVSADAMSNLGANPYAILFDEVLAQPSRELWDYLAQGFGTRPNQLLIGITTPGPDRESFAYQEHLHSVQISGNPDMDPGRFAFVAHVDEEADWQDESLWPDANPGLGTIIDIDQLRREKDAALAKGDMSAIANFRIFRLGQWGNSASKWLDMMVWDEADELNGEFTDDDVAEVDAIAGLDLADTQDFVAWTLAFPTEERVMVKTHVWITRKMVDTKHKRVRHKILEWAEKGYVTIVEQDAHDYDMITDHIMADIEKYRIRHLGYDQYQAPAIINKIESQTDVVCVKIPQTTQRMNPGAQELTRLLGIRRLAPGKDPVLRWMASNATYKQDNEGKIKPDKIRSRAPIDAVVTLVMALAVHTALPDQGDPGMFAFDDDELDYDFGEE